MRVSQRAAGARGFDEDVVDGQGQVLVPDATAREVVLCLTRTRRSSRTLHEIVSDGSAPRAPPHFEPAGDHRSSAHSWLDRPVLRRVAADCDLRMPSAEVTQLRWPSSSLLISVACPAVSGVLLRSHCGACAPQRWSGARGFDEDDLAQGDVVFPEAPSGPAVQWAHGSDWAAMDDGESGDEEGAEGWEVLTGEAVRALSPWRQPTS